MSHIHGHYGSSTYRSWKAMLQRCRDPNHEHYKYYGGRGITVHPSWLAFEAFLLDMGERPAGCTLDRINADGNYCPANCRWATPEEQSRSRRDFGLTYNGVTKGIREWSKELGLNRNVIRDRLNKGWPMERVMSADRWRHVTKTLNQKAVK